MNRDKELFRLAREHVMLTDLLISDRIYEEEYKEDINKIEKTILKEGYDVDKFVEYRKLYRRLTVAEYYEFLKTLD